MNVEEEIQRENVFILNSVDCSFHRFDMAEYALVVTIYVYNLYATLT